MATKLLLRKKSMARPPALVLKDLRERAGLTGQECATHLAKALKKKDRRGRPVTEGHPTTWFRYESTQPSPKGMGDRKIPYRVISAVMPLFVGRGKPPIQEDELLAVSEVHGLERVRPIGASASVTKSSVHETAQMFPRTPEEVKPLVVKYRAERGVFMLAETLEKRSFGVGPIVEASEYKAVQACVVVADDHADPVYPAGTVLHIIHISAYQPDELKGKRVAVSIPDKKTGMVEVAIGRIDEVIGNSLVIKSLHGEELDGEVLGVVYRSLRRE